jgi:beta-glucosidase
MQIKPAFSFGFGLNYADFQISNVRLLNPSSMLQGDTLVLECTIANNGSVKGAEVLQLYVGSEDKHVDHPVKLLRSFVKSNLGANESSAVTFRVPIKQLAYYDVETKSWVVAKGEYNAWITNSSDVSHVKAIPFSIR